MYFVYILSNKAGSVLYIGVTNDIQRRVYEHKHKLIKGFTQKYNVDKLVFVESFVTVNEAISAEKRIKGWNRAKKLILISSANPDWKDLLIEI